MDPSSDSKFESESESEEGGTGEAGEHLPSLSPRTVGPARPVGTPSAGAFGAGAPPEGGRAVPPDAAAAAAMAAAASGREGASMMLGRSVDCPPSLRMRSSTESGLWDPSAPRRWITTTPLEPVGWNGKGRTTSEFGSLFERMQRDDTMGRGTLLEASGPIKTTSLLLRWQNEWGPNTVTHCPSVTLAPLALLCLRPALPCHGAAHERLHNGRGGRGPGVRVEGPQHGPGLVGAAVVAKCAVLVVRRVRLLQHGRQLF